MKLIEYQGLFLCSLDLWMIYSSEEWPQTNVKMEYVEYRVCCGAVEIVSRGWDVSQWWLTLSMKSVLWNSEGRLESRVELYKYGSSICVGSTWVKCLYLNQRGVILGGRTDVLTLRESSKYIHTRTGFWLGRDSLFHHSKLWTVVVSDNNYSLEQYVRYEGRRPCE